MYENANGKLVFAQLVLIFSCHACSEVHDSETSPIALVHPYDQEIPARERPRKDKDLELLRFRARPRKECEFIDLHSIIRGALLVSDPDVPDEKFVVDIVDTDMFLRLRGLHRML